MQAEPWELTSCRRNTPCWDLTPHTLWRPGGGEDLAATGGHCKPQTPAFHTSPTEPDGSEASCALGLVPGENQGHPEKGDEKDPVLHWPRALSQSVASSPRCTAKLKNMPSWARWHQ